jgi:selenocysteine-specific elongation factor
VKVIGTAGHVDHGKSTLIAALTGTHPDRLKEEREREMTIDLGFGWLTGPNGEEIGIVDVPGHRDFVENMLAGVSGIDAALLVVAADEGVMPQTREHLAILDLLQITAGVVVISKIDLVSDRDWLELVEGDIRAVLSGTGLQEAPAVRVSARTGQGLDLLLSKLGEVLGNTPARADLGRPRLPVDRVFSMAGFGTIVTGTLADGHLTIGDEVVVLPSGRSGRVRGLQTHKKQEERALPGSRTAINISGLSVEEIRRGDIIAAPRHYQPTRRVDARLRLLRDSSPLRHAAEVKFFTGTSEIIGTVLLLETDRLQPGEETWVQLELREPVVVLPGDRYILRRPSPAETLGGGTIVDATPNSRHRRRDTTIIGRLASLSTGSPVDLMMEAALTLGPAPLRDITARSRLDPEAAASALDELIPAGTLIMLEQGAPSPGADCLAVPAAQWEDLAGRISRELAKYHQRYPLRRGMPREELKSRLELGPRVFSAVINHASYVLSPPLTMESSHWVALSGHEIKFAPAEQARVEALLAKFAAAPFGPPSIKECQAEVGDEVYGALVARGELHPVSADVVFRERDYDGMVARTREYLRRNGRMTVAEARDLFNTSRKYVLALLEHLDATGVTVRDGDHRRLPG